MSSLTITLRDTAIAALSELPALVSSPAALTQGGIGLRRAVVRNLKSLPANSRWPGATTNFWERAAASVASPVVEGRGVTVSVTQVGVRYNYLGGTIQAPWRNGSTTKYLTIPAQADAYGHRAREFDDLSVAFLGRSSTTGLPILALVRGLPLMTSRPPLPTTPRNGTTMPTASRSHAEGSIPPQRRLNVMFWLVDSVTRDPNPAVLPPEDEMRSAFSGGIRSFVNGSLGRRALTLSDLN